MEPTDQTTHLTLLRYHAGREPDLPAPIIGVREVEAELREDEWASLVTDNGEYVPPEREGKSRAHDA